MSKESNKMGSSLKGVERGVEVERDLVWLKGSERKMLFTERLHNKFYDFLLVEV